MRSSDGIMSLLMLLILAAIMPTCSKTAESSRPIVDKPLVQERDIWADDVALHIRIAGDPGAGNALIAIHGGPGMSSDYMVSLEQLASAEFAVVTYDQRGTGRSSSPPEEASSYVLEKYVADLEAVRKAVDVEQVQVMGHSWGGLVAMRYATLHPQRVRSLVLVASGPPEMQAVRAGQERLRQRIATLQGQGVIPQTLSSVGDILPAYYADPHFEPPDELRNPYYNPTVERLTWSALGDYDLTAEVADLDHPVLLLWGRDDPFGLPMAKATENALSSAQVEWVALEGCGHFWHECPDVFFPHVRAFLELPATP